MVFKSYAQLSRKYVQLVHTIDGNYGNYEPTNSVELGDYGTVTKETGSFEKEGNIFDERQISSRYNGEFVAIGVPKVNSPSTYTALSSTGIRQTDVTANAGMPNGELNLKFQFREQYGVVLVMVRPTIKKFPNDGNLRVLLKSMDEDKKLSGKVIVTSITCCSAYAFVVSKGRDNSVTFSLSGALQPTAEGSVGILIADGSNFVARKEGSIPGMIYTPVFELSVLKTWKHWFSSIPAKHRAEEEEMDDSKLPLQAYLPPWGPLDEDGEEIPDDDEEIEEVDD